MTKDNEKGLIQEKSLFNANIAKNASQCHLLCKHIKELIQVKNHMNASIAKDYSENLII